MESIRIRSIGDPFRSQPLLNKALATVRLAEAMGLLRACEGIETLDLTTFGKIGDAIAEAGIGHDVLASLRSVTHEGPERLAALLEELNEALEESPVPDREWPLLEGRIGAQLLGRLVHVSPASVRRYRSGTRATPDDVAARLHFLAKVVGDLSGAYNDIGVRRWFERSRTALDGKSPTKLLTGSWRPEDPGPVRVRRLARSLVGSPAT